MAYSLKHAYCGPISALVRAEVEAKDVIRRGAVQKSAADAGAVAERHPPSTTHT
jgi:hypothetical protein